MTPSLQQLVTTYSVDSNIFFDFWGTKPSAMYPKSSFPHLWTFFLELIRDGRVNSSVEVHTEVKVEPDTRFQSWIASIRHIFYDVEQSQVETLRQIVNRYPDYTKSRNHKADPVLVALAKDKGTTVLTMEVQQPHVGRIPAIPNLADEWDVDWANVSGFIADEGIPSRVP